LLAVVSACSPPPGVPVEKGALDQGYFFSTSDFFEREAERLSSLDRTLTKTVWVNSQQESQTLDSVNWEAELALFRKADINRPAWTEKYRGDTLYYEDRSAKTFYYEANSPDLQVRRLEVHWGESGQVKQIDIHKTTKSLIETVEQDLRYQPDSGYQLRERSSSWLDRDSEIRIVARFE